MMNHFIFSEKRKIVKVEFLYEINWIQTITRYIKNSSQEPKFKVRSFLLFLYLN